MSNFNQKGPMGESPMIGCKKVRCGNFGAGRRKQTIQENVNTETLVDDSPINDNQVNNYAQGQGLGRRCARGMGRGMRNRMGNGPTEQGQGEGIGQNRGGRGMGQSGGGRGMGMGRRFRGDIQE